MRGLIVSAVVVFLRLIKHCLSFMAGIKGYQRHTAGAGVGRDGSTSG